VENFFSPPTLGAGFTFTEGSSQIIIQQLSKYIILNYIYILNNNLGRIYPGANQGCSLGRQIYEEQQNDV
jgi:hypothetical protein